MRVLVPLLVFASLVVAPAARAADATVWGKFTVKDVTLGMPLKAAQQKGFVGCAFPERYNKEDHPFFKFFDKRCDKGTGNVCEVKFRDGCSIYYNGEFADEDVKIAPEYAAVVATTDTDSPRVWKILYNFPVQLLAADSPLGKAMITKYGKPTNAQEPVNRGSGAGGRMSWYADGFNMQLDCEPTQIAQVGSSKWCRLTEEDQTIRSADKAKQRALDEEKAMKNQPAPPSL